MTVRLETKINRYIGLSTDEKPYPGQADPTDADGHEMTAADLPPGSTFLEADTEEIWRWDGREWGAADNRTVRELKEIAGLLGELVDQGRNDGSL